MEQRNSSPDNILKAAMSIAPVLIGLGYVYSTPNISWLQATLVMATEGIVSASFLTYQLKQYKINALKLEERIKHDFTRLEISQLERPTDVNENEWGHSTSILTTLEESASLLETGGGDRSIFTNLLFRIKEKMLAGRLPQDTIAVIAGVIRRHNLDPNEFKDLISYEEDPDERPGGWSE